MAKTLVERISYLEERMNMARGNRVTTIVIVEDGNKEDEKSSFF